MKQLQSMNPMVLEICEKNMQTFVLTSPKTMKSEFRNACAPYKNKWKKGTCYEFNGDCANLFHRGAINQSTYPSTWYSSQEQNYVALQT